MKINFLNNLKFWLLSLLILLLALVSCSPEPLPEAETPTVTATTARTATRALTNTPEPTPTPTPPVGLEIDPDELDGVVVRFAHPWVGEPAEAFERIAQTFSLTNPWGIWVESYAHGGETALFLALQEKLEQGELPGLIAAPPYLLSTMAGDYALVDLDGYYNDPEWGLSADEREDIPTVFLEPFSIEEELIAMPFAPQATVLFYNRTWGEELGFTAPPNDLDAFRTQSCVAATANNQDDDKPNGTGGWVINLDPRVLAGWYTAFGGTLPMMDTPSFNNPEGQDTFGYLWSVKADLCIWFSLQPEPYDYFVNRFALLYAGQLNQIPVQMNWMDAFENEDDWETFGIPGPTGEKIIVDGPGLMIIEDSPEQELAAWLFIKYLLEPQVQAELVQSLFSLPVRASAMALLGDFSDEYPQWAQGAALVDTASALPVSDEWAIAQWVLQDAVNRILQDETGDVGLILGQLDDLIEDLAGPAP